MARIPLFPLERMTEEQQRVYDAVVSGPRGVVVGPLRAALHRPELADKCQQLGEILRYRTSLAPRLSELAILVTARHWTSQLEWQQHAPAALKGGLAPEVIEAIRQGQRPPLLKEDEEAIFEFSLQLQEKKRVDDKTYEKTLELIGVQGVVELTALIGYYTMVAMTLIAHEIPLPDGSAPMLD
ncbi:MAG: carboxymuconolactone decarboxylase family protein [Betaproteobacteria bacterium]